METDKINAIIAILSADWAEYNQIGLIYDVEDTLEALKIKDTKRTRARVNQLNGAFTTVAPEQMEWEIWTCAEELLKLESEHIEDLALDKAKQSLIMELRCADHLSDEDREELEKQIEACEVIEELIEIIKAEASNPQSMMESLGI